MEDLAHIWNFVVFGWNTHPGAVIIGALIGLGVWAQMSAAMKRTKDTKAVRKMMEEQQRLALLKPTTSA